MTKNIKQILKLLSFAIICSVLLANCEPEPDNLGEQFFVDNQIEGERADYDIIAYNSSNDDIIQADSKTLDVLRLGAFKEDVFGMQKASFVSQVRLSRYDPDFGTNAVLDSVVLYMNPLYLSDSIVSQTSTDIDYPDGEGGTLQATQDVRRYPVIKYGNEKVNNLPTMFTINVHEVTDFLKSNNEDYYSNQNVNLGSLLGSKQFDGNISYVKINDKSNTPRTLFETAPTLRISLDNVFFQNKIIDEQGSDNLKDPATFIRYFRGVKISVSENDGYLFGITPNNLKIKLYYKYENSSGNMASSEFELLMGNDNVHIGQYQYDRSNSMVQSQLSSINSVDGDSKLYLQGMGGPGAIIKIPASVVTSLRDKFNNDKIGIIGAKIRVYIDVNVWDNNYKKPSSYVLLQNGATSLMPDLTDLSGVANFRFIKPYDLNEPTSYYDLTVTQTLKKAIEATTANEDIVLKINIGDFKLNQNGRIAGYQFVTTPYAPERVVLVGTDANNDKRIKLQVTYALKN